MAARRLLPPKTHTWDGGRMAFEMRVDPRKANYFTARFWGSDVNDNKLLLFCDGKQVGYHFIGDYDALDVGTEGTEGAFKDRFYYVTTVLPNSLTKGKSVLHLEIRSLGPIFSYGSTFALYQKPQIIPSRGIYAVYTTTDGYFQPPPDEVQGVGFSRPSVRSYPGPEVLEALKARLNKTIDGLTTKKGPLQEMEIHTLARAYNVPWTDAYHNPHALAKIVEGGDDLYLRFKADPNLVVFEKDTYNPEWFGFGPFAQAVEWLSPLIDMDEGIPDGQGKIVTRKFAYAEMFKASRDFLRTHRRWYTNQSMIVDLYAYLSNRGLRVVDPSLAFSEKRMLDYLYQSLGLRPWLGSDLVEGGSERKLGDSYSQVTRKGLTRELGYVGYYGEVLDWITLIYDATKGRGDEGDPVIKAQVIKMGRARSYFRFPSVDSDGHRAMRVETIIGWRDAHYPSDVVYGERFSWDGTALYLPTEIQDRYSVGYAQQMMDDHQLFSLASEAMKRTGLRVDAGLLNLPDQYDAIRKAAPSPERLPMSEKKDFAFTDEEDGVVALKNGSDILYASLYWRARSGINFLGRVHFIRPNLDRIATVQEEIHFTPSGRFYTRPDNVDSLSQGTPYRDYGDLHSAHAGEQDPIPVVPPGTSYVYGDESVFAGRGSFYVLRYGRYVIAMNMTKDKTYAIDVPTGFRRVKELVSQKWVAQGVKRQAVKPLSTVIFYASD